MDVKCPRCKKPTVFDATNPFRPFCSERCRTIDLGAWADEAYRVPEPLAAADASDEPRDDDGSRMDERPPKHKLN